MTRVGAGALLRHPPDDVELALEGVAIAREVARGADQQLTDDRRSLACRVPDVLELHRDVAPAEDTLPLLLDRGLEDVLELGPPLLLATRQEGDTDAVGAGRGQLPPGDGAEELVGQLEEHPGAVPGERVGARGTTVLEVLECAECPLERLVRRLPVQPRDEGDTAGVMLERGVVEADRFGRASPSLGVRRCSGAVRHREWAFRSGWPPPLLAS